MTMTATNYDQRMQFYQQSPMHEAMVDLDPHTEGFIDATICTSSSKSMLSPRNSSESNTTSSHHLTPKACAFKAIRRRCRASKATPVILLKANTSNFRAMVQKFTGCPSTTAMSLAIHKGPITLNFQQGCSKQQIQHHTRKTTRVPPFGTMISSNRVSKPQQHRIMREKQSGYLLEKVEKSNSFLPTSGNSYGPISCMGDGFLFDNDFSLHELTVNAISYDIEGLLM